ncbi:5050_t:CDS:1, partial [Rhizophagus irregularis]
IIERWQKRVAKRYNQNFNCNYEEFHHLYFDLKAGVEVSDYRIKNNLIKVLEKGNIKYYELQTMSLYKQHRNKVAHKKKWKPEDKNKGQRKEATKMPLSVLK